MKGSIGAPFPPRARCASFILEEPSFGAVSWLFCLSRSRSPYRGLSPPSTSVSFFLTAVTSVLVTTGHWDRGFLLRYSSGP